MMDRLELQKLMTRAHDGTLTPKDADAAAALLPSADSEGSYDALFVIGKAGGVRHRDLVERYLERPDDPMLSRLALQILASWWGFGADYLPVLRSFAEGVPWDLESGGYVRSVAISAAGELLRYHSNTGLLSLLLRIYDTTSEPDDVRREAYAALLRAAGIDWRDVPGTASSDWQLRPNAGILAALRRDASLRS